MKYKVESSLQKDTVWIHAPDGSTVGRFSRFGVDMHNTITQQINGAPQCRLCTHGRPTKADWELFREKANEWWGVTVLADLINSVYLQGTAVAR